ncbi:hypothetical protein [Dyella silvatica]|uniref:hypothetical protein n=1 Tax=Dyella silvatica TaxID=2992128 RepID=UPI00225428FA|nr:hypothetical protein [Dyella silvatica]
MRYDPPISIRRAIMQKRITVWVAAVLLGGCGFNAKTIQLPLPSANVASTELKPIILDSVADARDFTKLPDASEPRVSKSVIQQLGSSGRAAVIFGIPDVSLVFLLADNKTVAAQMSDIVGLVLRERGYYMVEPAKAPGDAPHISMRVTEFWAYPPSNLGRSLTFTRQIKAWVSTDITIKAKGIEQTFAVHGSGANIANNYNEENISETYSKAIDEYTSSLRSKLPASL